MGQVTDIRDHRMLSAADIAVLANLVRLAEHGAIVLREWQEHNSANAIFAAVEEAKKVLNR